MAESITASATLHRPALGAISPIHASARRRIDLIRIPFLGRSLYSSPSVSPVRSRALFAIRAVAEELTREEERIPRGAQRRLFPPPNRADNPALHNPLLRQERLGCGWISAIFELEGVIVEDDPELEREAWVTLSQEEGKSSPPAFLLRRIEGMKTEQAISEVLCWSRDPSELRRLASRKEEIHHAIQGGVYCLRPGSVEFMISLMNHKIPIAITSTRPRKNLEETMEAVGIKGSFDAIVTAEDVHRAKPDPEMLIYAAQLLNFIPERCIVFGSSNLTVEAAHDAQMKCVAVASKHPVYELGAADLVVRKLTELSIVNLKNLAAMELGQEELEVEMEKEEEESSPFPTTSTTHDVLW